MKKFTPLWLAAIVMLLLLQSKVSAQVVFSQNATGIYTFTVSSTATYKIQCWGGGGRGGPRANNNGGAGGGGGGAYSCSSLVLTPGIYTIKVGKGGVDPGNADGDSSYIKKGSLLVMAMGGFGVNPNSATGTAGGSAALGIGTTKYSGGSGANGTPGSSGYGGGGGSSAGAGSNGNNGVTFVGGSAPAGGAKGGNGKSGADGPGLPGDSPGGAGGGARKLTSGGGQNDGGLGSPGKVEIALNCVPPSINLAAANLTVECDGGGNVAALTGWLSSHGGATAILGCGNLNWTNNFSALSGSCGASATVTFTVTDGSGNTATTSATFNIVDTTAPSISPSASNQTVECDGAGNLADLAAWLAGHGGASASDACSAVTWTNNFTGLSDDCGATGSATVVFTATDACGLSSTTSATFTIADSTPPTAVCQNVTLEYDAYGHVSTTAANVDNGSSDACGGVTLSLSQTDFDCTDFGNNTVTLTVTDDCGNSSTCTATVTVIVPLIWRCHNNEKVIFCHVPPNFPAQNIQEICVGMDMQTICDHLGHGDHFGPCDGTEVGYQVAITNGDVSENNVPSENISNDQLHATTNGNGESNHDIYVQPNPFSSVAAIHFNMTKKDEVVLKVFNSMGELENVLYNGILDAGQHSFNFDAANKSEGLYYFSLTIGNKLETRRMILAR